MNLRLSGTGVRFRITQEEMLRVLAGEPVCEVAPLVPPLRIIVKIGPASPLQLATAAGEVTLLVSRNALTSLSAAFPEIEEIVGSGGVALEVDLHTRRGGPQK